MLPSGVIGTDQTPDDRQMAALPAIGRTVGTRRDRVCRGRRMRDHAAAGPGTGPDRPPGAVGTANLIPFTTAGPRSSGDRAPPSGGGSAGSNPAGGALHTRTL